MELHSYLLVIATNTISIMTQSSDHDSVKYEPVVLPKEVQRLIDMGLGRGVDATSRNVWKQKSAFQVRFIASSL